jgi:K+-transporting ATPase ATPase C chain
MSKTIYRSVVLTVFMFILLGCIYPIVVTFVGKYLFPAQSSGGILFKGNIPIGAELIGQSFTQAKYFWSRPSAACYHVCKWT